MGKSFSSSGYQKSLGDFDTGMGGWSTGKKSSHSCYHSHPKLKIGGGTLIGGSCLYPVVENADVYVGLDRGMTVIPYEPWEGEELVQILYPITDMHAPSSVSSFTKLVDYLCNQLQKGKVVHCGCIGGHGRTGTLFSALFKVITDDQNAIETVRKLYCAKAVESDAQVKFLNKHFGIEKVKPTKTRNTMGPSVAEGHWSTGWPKSGGSEIKGKPSAKFSTATKVWKSVNSPLKVIGTLI